MLALWIDRAGAMMNMMKKMTDMSGGATATAKNTQASLLLNRLMESF